ncbi:LOW QUALITY PROTEIN: hypothetical protein HZS_8151 [Henneguya salminicola]|nr:LOW QUALITY PROTEIN: hypothetical protein HZS_8151 [Henneguya salminicola]
MILEIFVNIRQCPLKLIVMIDSLYIITTQSEIFYERHWIPDSNIYPLDSLLRCVLRETKPLPVFKAGACVVFSLFEEDIGFISVVSKEISPFYVLELLNQIKEVLASYFECMTSTRLKDKITFVYIIIDEMFANGIPILNWPSLLHQIIKPPTYLDKLASTLSTTKKIEMNNAALYEPIVWRDHSAIVNNCEVLIDVIETLNLTIDKNGSKINTEIYGTADRVLDFVPPDGKINLLTYTCNASDIYLPFDLDHNLSSKDVSRLFLF